MHRRAILKAAVFAPALRSVSAASAEGPAIAYVRDGNLWSAALDGSGRRQLTDSGRDSHPAWSRDGGSLAFLRREKPGDDADFGRLYVMRRDGSRERRTTPHLCTRPLWSPVADEIATVGSPEPEQLRLLFLSPEGKPTRAAIPLEKMVQPPPWGWMALSDWHPAGKLMSFRVMGHLTRDGLIGEPMEGMLKRIYDLSHLPKLEEDEVSAFAWRPGHEEAAALSAPGLMALRRIGREQYTRTLWLCQPDGTRLKALYRSKALDVTSLSWDRSAKTVVVESGGMLMRIEIESGRAEKLWPGAQPAWAPPARLIAR